jgi:hypothetical protein
LLDALVAKLCGSLITEQFGGTWLSGWDREEKRCKPQENIKCIEALFSVWFVEGLDCTIIRIIIMNGIELRAADVECTVASSIGKCDIVAADRKPLPFDWSSTLIVHFYIPAPCLFNN